MLWGVKYIEILFEDGQYAVDAYISKGDILTYIQACVMCDWYPDDFDEINKLLKLILLVNDDDDEKGVRYKREAVISNKRLVL